MRAQLDVFLPLPLTKRGPSYACGMLAKGMAGADLDITIVTPRKRALDVAPSGVVQSLPLWARYIPYKWVRSRAMENLNVAFLSQVSDVTRLHGAYIWPDAKLSTLLELHHSNIRTFREMTNCHRGTAKSILDSAYIRFGSEPLHGITDASIQEEWKSLEVIDYIFCPNAMVEASLIENGVAASKIISTSYGWEPERLRGTNKLLSSYDGVTFVFAGSICVRKGCHLLLDYWSRSNVRGRLVLAGAIEPAIRERCGDLLARDNVMVLDYVSDIGALYRSADIFVFASLEEGGPLVTYEACGCALPVITTPMGAGRIVRHNREGYVLDPYDADAWITAIQSLAEDQKLRLAMSRSADKRAQLFCWNAVAERRKRQIFDRFFNSRSATGGDPTRWNEDEFAPDA